MTATGLALAFIAAIALSVSVLSVRVGTDSGRSADAVIIVLFVNVGILVPITLLAETPVTGLTMTAVASFGMAGLVGTLVGRVFYYASIERVGASRSEPIKASQPIYAVTIAVVLLGEQLSLEHLVGIVLIVLGVAAISWETASSSDRGEARASDLLFPLTAAFFYGIEPIFAKVGFETGTSVLVGLSIKTAVATGGFLGYIRWQNALPDWSGLVSPSLRWYLLAGVGNTTFLLTYYAALEIAPVVLVVPIIQLSPLIVAVLSYLFLKRLETVTLPLVLSSLVVVTGAILVSLNG